MNKISLGKVLLLYIMEIKSKINTSGASFFTPVFFPYAANPLFEYLEISTDVKS